MLTLCAVQNFMRCWREAMTKDEKAKIKDLTKCDFTRIQAHYDSLSEARKAATKEEKAARKEKEVRFPPHPALLERSQLTRGPLQL